MNYENEQGYLAAIKDLLTFGEVRGDRTGTGTLSLFGTQMKFRLDDYRLPLITTKKVFFKGVLVELLWLLSGKTNISFMTENDVHIWDEWADENGELGPVYGKQWRKWLTPYEYKHDQIKEVIDSLKHNPLSRRHIVSAWNVGEIEDMALPPCHMFFQFYVSKGKYLKCHMYMRSADIFLGVPFNIASYALLTHMIAQVTGLEANELTISFGDMHLYLNHTKQAKEQLERENDIRSVPLIRLNKDITDIDDFTIDDFVLEGYNPHSMIKAPISV